MDDGDEQEHAASCVEVPHRTLDPDVLQRLLEEFVTRDGTDYGEVERTLPEKVAALRRLLEQGEAAIVFDPRSESVDVVVRRPGS